MPVANADLEAPSAEYQREIVRWTISAGGGCVLFGLLNITVAVHNWTVITSTVVAAIVACGVLVWLTHRTRRIITFQLLRILILIILLVLVWRIALAFTAESLGEMSWIMIVIAIMSNAIGFLLHYNDQLARLRALPVHARVDILAKPAIAIWSPQYAPEEQTIGARKNRDRLATITRWVIGFAPLIGQLIAKSTRQGKVFVAVLAYLFAFTVLALIAANVAALIELRAVEGRLRKTLLAPRTG